MNNLVLIGLILHYSAVFGVDPVVSLAVARVESNMNPQAVNAETHDFGLYQLHQETFKEYTPKQLLDPETNVKLGIQYLAQMKDTCIHQQDYEFVICFNLGPEKAKKVHHPKLFPYYKSVIAKVTDGQR